MHSAERAGALPCPLQTPGPAEALGTPVRPEAGDGLPGPSLPTGRVAEGPHLPVPRGARSRAGSQRPRPPRGLSARAQPRAGLRTRRR